MLTRLKIQEQEAIYALLVALQNELLVFMKDGVTARDVYQHALFYVKEKKPELEKHFVKSAGHGVCMVTFKYFEGLTVGIRWA